jgi:hypothetical protein
MWRDRRTHEAIPVLSRKTLRETVTPWELALPGSSLAAVRVA